MQSIWQEVFDDARAHLNDTQVTGGVNWPNPRLQVHAARAYRKMFDALASIANNRVRHTVYFQLPAYTTQFVPAANGITDMAEPELLSERGSVTTGAITSTSATSPITVTTTSPHNLGSTGAQVDVVIDQVNNTFDPWGRWFATITGPSAFTLNGSIANVPLTAGAGGFFSTGTQKFVDMVPVPRIIDEEPSSSLINWWWENNVLQFRGATKDTQVRLIYIASGKAPTNPNTIILIDNSLNFLGCATAFYALGSVGAYQRRDQLKVDAFGPTGESDGSGGFLRDLLAPAVLEMQREPKYPKTFRPSKNTLIPFTWG